MVGYYTVSDDQTIGAEELREHLKKTLPEYMVPAAYVCLERMPLTVNGKLDRKALPEPEGDAYGEREYEEPQGEIERKLAAIWEEVLHVERVGRHDNFFELGGHSLLAVTVIERMRQNRRYTRRCTSAVRHSDGSWTSSVHAAQILVEVPANRIPANARRFARRCCRWWSYPRRNWRGLLVPYREERANVQDIYPLAPLQEGILFHHLMGGEGDPYMRDDARVLTRVSGWTDT